MPRGRGGAQSGLDTAGPGRHPVTGEPPGGVVSPVRAKGCLPDVLDGWCVKGANGPVAAWLRPPRPSAELCGRARTPNRGAPLRHSVRATVRARRPGTVSGQATAPARQWAAPRRATRGECLGASGGGARSARGTILPDRRADTPGRAPALHRDGGKTPRPRRLPVLCQRLPLNSAGRTTPTAASRGRRQAARGLPPSQTAWAAVAQAASPTLPLSLARLPRSPGALASGPPGSLEGGVKNPETQPPA